MDIRITKTGNEAIHKEMKRKEEPTYFIQNKDTGRIVQAKESYAKKLQKENKYKILSIK